MERHCKLIFIIPFILLLAACNTDNKKLLGSWQILKITHINKLLQDERDVRLIWDIFSFEDNGKCTVPMIDPYNSDRLSNWEFTTEGKMRYIVITPKVHNKNTEFFSGKYTFYFYNDPIHRLNMLQLESDNLKITCTGFLTPYKD